MELEVKTENKFLGLIGAIIGAAVGSLLWILLDQFGFIASIAAFVIILCSVKGYKLLAKGISKAGIIICIVVAVLMVLAADLVSFGIEIYRTFAADFGISLGDAFLSIPNFFAESEVVTGFAINLVIGYVFTALGCFKFVRTEWKKLSSEDTSVESADESTATEDETNI